MIMAIEAESSMQVAEVLRKRPLINVSRNTNEKVAPNPIDPINEDERPAKRVRFASQALVRIYHGNTSNRSTSKLTSYYSKCDYKHFIKECRQTAIKHFDHKYAELLACTHLSTNCSTDIPTKKQALAIASDSAELPATTSLSQLSRACAEQLGLHAVQKEVNNTSEESLRGLEVALSPDLVGSAREQRKKKRLQAVLMVQEKYLPFLTTDEKRIKLLQAVSERYSEHSVKFAHALGIADSIVASAEYEQTLVLK